MKKSISFLVVCMVLISSSAFAMNFQNKEIRFEIAKGAGMVMIMRQIGIPMETQLATSKKVAANMDCDANMKAELVSIHELIIRDAYTYPIEPVGEKRDAVNKAFLFKWYYKLADF